MFDFPARHENQLALRLRAVVHMRMLEINHDRIDYLEEASFVLEVHHCGHVHPEKLGVRGRANSFHRGE